MIQILKEDLANFFVTFWTFVGKCKYEALTIDLSQLKKCHELFPVRCWIQTLKEAKKPSSPEKNYELFPVRCQRIQILKEAEKPPSTKGIFGGWIVGHPKNFSENCLGASELRRVGHPRSEEAANWCPEFEAVFRKKIGVAQWIVIRQIPFLIKFVFEFFGEVRILFYQPRSLMDLPRLVIVKAHRKLAYYQHISIP